MIVDCESTISLHLPHYRTVNIVQTKNAYGTLHCVVCVGVDAITLCHFPHLFHIDNSCVPFDRSFLNWFLLL